MENQLLLCDGGAVLEETNSADHQVRFLMADISAAWATCKDSDVALSLFRGTQLLCFISGSRACWEHLLFYPEKGRVSLLSGFLRAPEASRVTCSKG